MSSYGSAPLPNVSAQAMQKHALFMPKPTAQAPASSAYQRPKYPEFDRTPVPQLDLLTGEPAQPSAPAMPSVQELSLMDAHAQPRPSAGPSLGPQEMEVRCRHAASGCLRCCSCGCATGSSKA
jgi:hypothetical protein